MKKRNEQAVTDQGQLGQKPRSYFQRNARNGFAAALALSLAAAFSGCGKTEFLYWTQPRTGKQFNYSHRLRDIAGNPNLDVLWVIDNSPSMGPHQRRVIDNAQLFINEFSKQATLNWRIGLLSSDLSESPYLGLPPRPILDHTTPDAILKFQRGVGSLGLSGSGVEQFFEPVLRVVEGSAGNIFLRPDAILAVIFVTDAPEQSTVGAAEFLQSLELIKGSRDKIAGFGVLGPGDWGCPSTDDDWDYRSSKFEQFLSQVNGKNYKLCEDFGPGLAEMGKILVQLSISPKIFLEARPRAGTVKITYQGRVLPPGPKAEGGFWVYDPQLNAILFHDLDFAGSNNSIEDVQVSYLEDSGQDLPSG